MIHGQEHLESKLIRRFAPFAAVGLLAPLTAALPPRPDDWTYVWIAGVLTAVIAAVGLLVPWSRLPRWTYIVPPLAYFVVVALLREANDGSVSGCGGSAAVSGASSPTAANGANRRMSFDSRCSCP